MKQLPNLDGLRFLAASLVVIFHVDYALVWNNYKSSPYKIFPFNFGELAVVLFFVISGFLITYLLIKEKEHSKINVKSFYLKRILRIWPLYYLLLVLSFAFFNNSPFFHWEDLTQNMQLSIGAPVFIFLLLIICPNVALLVTPSLGYANPTWSIGVEEQFYLLWPHVLKRRNPAKIIILIIISVFLLSQGAIQFMLDTLSEAGMIKPGDKVYSFFFVLNRFFTFPYSFKIDAMAIGSVGSLIACYKPHLMRYIFSTAFQCAFYLVFLASIFLLTDRVPYQVFSVLFILLIMNLALNPATIVRLEHRALRYLGKISYGIYIFHSLTIIPVIKFTTKVLGLPVTLMTEVLMCFLSLALTIAISAISYKYYESYFLRLKARLAHRERRSLEVD